MQRPLIRAAGPVAAAAAAVLTVAFGVAPSAHGQMPAGTAHVSATRPAAASALPPVTHVRAWDAGARYAISWSIPPSSSVTGTSVRLARGSVAPDRPWHGTSVPHRPHATTVTLTHLRQDTAYSVAIWTRDSRGRYSAARAVHFTTDSSPAADGVITGTVTDRAGHPLAGAVVVTDSDNDLPTSVVTSVSGRFRLTVPAAQNYLVVDGSNATGGTGDATGYVSAEDFAAPRAGRTTDLGRIRLATGAAVTGRVTDGSGAPLAGVAPVVSAVGPYAGAGGGFGFLDSFGSSVGSAPVSHGDGSYLIKGIPTEALRMCFSTAAAPVTGGTSTTGYAGACSTQPFEALPGTIRTLRAQSLDPAGNGELSGRITDGAGHPVAQAEVDISTADDNNDAEVTTAADGTFVALGLPQGSYSVCAGPTSVPARGAGLAATCLPHRVRVGAGATAAVTVRLPAGAALTGTVTGPDGSRLDGVAVYLLSPSTGDFFAGSTGTTGQFRIANVDAGAYSVCFDTSDTYSAREPTGALSGCFRSRRPIVLRPSLVRTGVDVRLRAAGAVSGRVLDAAGHPVRGALVQAAPTAQVTDLLGGGGIAVTDQAGRYVIRNLPAGPAAVCFQSFDGAAVIVVVSGDPMGTCVKARVRLGHTTRAPNGKLAAPSSVRVHVRDAEGNALAGVDAVALSPCSGHDPSCDVASVFSRNKPVSFDASVTTDSTGTGQLGGLAPGRYAVCLFAYYAVTPAHDAPLGYADACTGSTYSVAVVRGRTTTVTLTLGDAGAISGRVTDQQGAPVPGVAVDVPGAATTDYTGQPFTPPASADLETLLSAGPAADVLTDRDGRYTVRSVNPGKHRVCLDPSAARGTDPAGYLGGCIGQRAGSLSLGTQFRVKARRTTTADATLSPAAGITGHVTSSSGKAVSATVIAFDSSGNPHAVVDTGRSGAFVLGPLPAGSWIVCFDAFRYQDQCYRNAAWVPGAAPSHPTKVRTRTGQLTPNIDARMTPAGG